MFNNFLSLIPPMLLGTQLILTLVLIKGEICPGQRGRLHKLFPAIGTLWLACSTLHVSALGVAAPVFYFYSQVQTKKTRDKGPIWVLAIGNLFSAIFVGAELMKLTHISAQIAGVLLVIVLGAVFSQLSLKVARSRLDAFQKILPLSGVVGVMFLLLMVALQSFNLDESVLVSLSTSIFAGIATLIAGTAVWGWHLLRASTAEKLQLSIALVLITAACLTLQPLFMV
ncbi:hypothetical protein P7F88_18325 [Vibrio hannami]|uniref:hypothetical protein n=1 Tax=Vibrio hannami TaxID=2717094 RepID=UPI00241085EE|nr:hypothetical protein [Vibrio hannami]MDG3087925.1 hypothetical protein [Vibrio hannami]